MALGRVDVRAAAYHHLDGLVEHTQESAGVSILDGGESINVLSKPNLLETDDQWYASSHSRSGTNVNCWSIRSSLASRVRVPA